MDKGIHYSLRPATADDFEFVRRLHHETLRPYIEPIWGWDEPVQDELVRKWFRPGRIQIIQISGEDAGLIVVEKQSNATHLLESISITPALQNRGAGSTLIREILNDARAAGASVTLQVLKTNPARQLYERLGFTVSGETSTHFLMKCIPLDLQTHRAESPVD